MTQHEKQNVSPKDSGYIRRFTRVIEYIYAHLDEDPDLATLAEVAALSPWHWHRVWQSAYGESIVATVKRLRLHRAAADLAYTDMPLGVVADRAGYGSLEAFSRSFKQSYGQAPSAYRRAKSNHQVQPAHGGAPLPNPKGAKLMHDVEIKSLPAEKLAFLRHKGPYMQIGQAFEKLVGVLVGRNLIGQAQSTKALFFSDPTRVPEDELESVAGVGVAEDFPVEAPLEAMETRGGDYAVLHYKGPYANMKLAYDWLYGEWLTQSGREPADAPCMEIYLNNPRDTAPADLLTDICLPLKPAA
ncbi:AraC family transcriptional regulator [Roseibium sediminicola]|uniref:AraC family transcriptional regulator n=1 Tax=Roseibium sediminicola TaxID=2933272 RepID=A0ABT0GSX5_9HYPH|nr:AraC family transcriptional regulator [Roseibium sp. CAU 1639]MCK7612544.1 AraC family transcriptional regulator [Roseibium sp. CAU 1639]